MAALTSGAQWILYLLCGYSRLDMHLEDKTKQKGKRERLSPDTIKVNELVSVWNMTHEYIQFWLLNTLYIIVGI